jgi:RNA polymerase sigma factor (sigma-70 family)
MLENENELIDLAVNGDRNALEKLLLSVQDLVYNLSLRMLGTIHDAEDASQEIIIRIITHLSGFRKESAFSTWVYRIAVNYLINCKKSMFAEHPLSFQFYGEDIEAGFIETSPDLLGGVEDKVLANELKSSCTNVMLQCMDAETRCIYVLGTMFKLDSKIAGDIMNISPEAFRQRLSRIRRKMGNFLNKYCGLAGGSCNCQKRIGYAITSHRLEPSNLAYSKLEKADDEIVADFIKSMENLDSLSLIFAGMPQYRTPQTAKDFIRNLMNSKDIQLIQNINLIKN